MPLSSLPDAFGLDIDLKKLYFPYLFNTKTNKDYDGLLPDKEFYCPDQMKEDDREKFLKWYEENKNENFNMSRDLPEYCLNDCKILAGACSSFRKTMIRDTEAVTIASSVNLAFRRKYLKPDMICSIPINGYRVLNNQSKLAIQWLIYESNKRGINITHSLIEKEVKIGKYFIDGFCEERGIIFEFLSCHWHGHEKCLFLNSYNQINKNTVEKLKIRRENTEGKRFRGGCDVRV